MQRQHRIQEAPWMQKSISMTFGFPGVRLLGFRVTGLGLYAFWGCLGFTFLTTSFFSAIAVESANTNYIYDTTSVNPTPYTLYPTP